MQGLSKALVDLGPFKAPTHTPGLKLGFKWGEEQCPRVNVYGRRSGLFACCQVQGQHHSVHEENHGLCLRPAQSVATHWDLVCRADSSRGQGNLLRHSFSQEPHKTHRLIHKICRWLTGTWSACDNGSPKSKPGFLYSYPPAKGNEGQVRGTEVTLQYSRYIKWVYNLCYILNIMLFSFSLSISIIY